MSAPDPDALEDRATTLASADDAARLNELASLLRTRDFLDALDPPETLLGPPSHLRVALVLDELSHNPATALTHPALVALCQDPVFTAAPARVDLLITILAEVRPAPPPVVAFWDRHCQPLDGFANLSVRALLENRSDPALALFEQKMLDESHEESTRVMWLHHFVVPHRDDLGVLGACERLLAVALSARVWVAVVESLFDYQLDAWYGPIDAPTPPPWETVSPPAQEVFVRIGTGALQHLAPEDPLQSVVARRIEDWQQPTAPAR